MVDRVSTAGQYSAILANLMAAENAQTNAENRVSSQKNGNDLKAYAQQAETLTAMKSVDARITNYLKDLLVEVADGPRPRMNGSKPARPPRALTP